MSSSTLAGEKRWASARRGGMTFLGKVAVPKPLNLPSQRLENHGLDPNVEIVPKGTLSWGNRSSSSNINAWTSLTLCPNTDGGSGSSSDVGPCPSSGGSGTRPSTAASDKVQEPAPSAWGPNSRPSSASGALTSNQSALTSLRPRSAETRPGSSQLSRFAESSSDNSVTWGPNGISEKLGGSSSINDGFNLVSGDFPTLGSEKENSGKNTESQDHGSYARPGSSSNRAASEKERTAAASVGDVSLNANTKTGTVDIWSRDGSQYVEGGAKHSVEKWQGDSHNYLNANIPPQHLDAWCGPPINAPPPGVWYRGPPGGPPYGPPLGPGGFPLEPFPYYASQVPAVALSNSQPMPLGGRPRGHHPRNADLYRPHIPDAYIRSNMPIRPGFYPAPMAYEGCYGPPMGFCSSNERDIPFTGMPPGSSVYNRYSGNNAFDPGKDHARAGAGGSAEKPLATEHVESSYHDNAQGQCKVLLKQHNEKGGKEGDQWEHTVPSNASIVDKGDQLQTLRQRSEWGGNDKINEEMNSGGRTYKQDASSGSVGSRKHNSSDTSKVKFSESVSKAKEVDFGLATKSLNAASTSPEVCQVFSASPKPSLIQKIEGLNAKARVSDGRFDGAVSTRGNCPANEAGTVYLPVESNCAGGGLIHSSNEVDIPVEDMSPQLTAFGEAAILRKTGHSMQGRLDHHGKRLNAQDADGWRKKPHAVETASIVSLGNSKTACTLPVQDLHTSEDAVEKPRINLKGKDEGESLMPVFDPSDSEAQHAKMREIARQRAKQLQKEEEERTREQKAKALAKLEELNKRTQPADGLALKVEKSPPFIASEQEKRESPVLAEPVIISGKSDTPSWTLVSNAKVVTQVGDGNGIGVGESICVSRNPHFQPLHDAQNADATHYEAAPQHSEGSVPRLKPMAHKQKHNKAVGKILAEKSNTDLIIPKDHRPEAVNEFASQGIIADKIASSGESNLFVSSNIVADPSAHQRRKNNRSSKIQEKLDNVPSNSPAHVPAVTVFPATVSEEVSFAKPCVESEKPNAFQTKLDPSSAQSQSDTGHATQTSEKHASLPVEAAHGRINNQWKPQQTRRIPRNQQTNKIVEKLHGSDAVIWAPVRAQSKTEVRDEPGGKTSDGISVGKTNTVVQTSLKSKRAELERYVPKPIAKELALLGHTQQLMSSSVDQAASDEVVGRVESDSQNIRSSELDNLVFGTISSSVESRNEDGRCKQMKTYESWHQWDSRESTNAQSLQDGQPSLPNLGKSVPKGQPKSSDDWNPTDGQSTPEFSDTTLVVTHLVKDQGMGRGRGHPSKGHRRMVNNRDCDPRNFNSGDADKSSRQPVLPEAGQRERGHAFKENRGVGERTASHWQPKSQSRAHDQRGSRSSGQSASAEANSGIDKDSSPINESLLSQNSKERVDHRVKHLGDQSLCENEDIAGAPNMGHPAVKKERKITPSKGRPFSPNQSPANMVESASGMVDTRSSEQRLSSGSYKNVNQNSRYPKGHESRGDCSPSWQDNRQHNQNANRERQRHSSHYEYQPIGLYNCKKPNNFEGSAESSHNDGLRYREKSQGHSRRGGGGGNNYKQQTGSAQVDQGDN